MRRGSTTCSRHRAHALVSVAFLLLAITATSAALAQPRGASEDPLDFEEEDLGGQLFGEDASREDYFGVGARTGYWAVTAVLVIACGILVFLLKGRRWVRLIILGTALEILVGYGWIYSALTAVLTGVLVLLVAGGAAFYMVRVWRRPAEPKLEARPFQPEDSVLLERANAWTRDGKASGFAPVGEYVTEFPVSKDVRRAWLRFLRHAERTCWAEISVTTSPKVASLRLVSQLDDGRLVETCNKLTMVAALGGEKVVAQRVGSGATIAEAYLAHQEVLGTYGARPRRIDDTVTMAAKVHREWAEALVAEERLERQGDDLCLPTKMAPTIFLRTAAALILG